QAPALGALRAGAAGGAPCCGHARALPRLRRGRLGCRRHAAPAVAGARVPAQARGATGGRRAPDRRTAPDRGRRRDPGRGGRAAGGRWPALIARAASGERDVAAREALLALALGTSPRVEDGGPGIVYVDLDGLGALHGDEPAIGERLARHTGRIGLPARLGIAGSRPAALSAA